MTAGVTQGGIHPGGTGCSSEKYRLYVWRPLGAERKPRVSVFVAVVGSCASADAEGVQGLGEAMAVAKDAAKAAADGSVRASFPKSVECRRVAEGTWEINKIGCFYWDNDYFAVSPPFLSVG